MHGRGGGGRGCRSGEDPALALAMQYKNLLVPFRFECKSRLLHFKTPRS